MWTGAARGQEEFPRNVTSGLVKPWGTEGTQYGSCHHRRVWRGGGRWGMGDVAVGVVGGLRAEGLGEAAQGERWKHERNRKSFWHLVCPWVEVDD